MALDIVTQDIIIDETTGLTDDDVNPAVAPHSTDATLQYLLSRDGAGGLAPEVAFQANFVVASASAGETITSVVLTQSSSGTPFSTTVGVNSNIRTADGNYVWLFQDPTHANVVIGVIGTSNPAVAPAANGPLAFSLGLVSTSATNADLYTVQYVPLFQPDATNADDRIDLTDKVFASVTGTSVVNFSQLGDAPPGHNNWYILDADVASTQKILVTAHDNGAQSEVNVSTQGLGVSSQDVRFGRELQIDLITGGTQSAGKNFTDAPTAPDYTAHIENVSGAGFSVSQSTPTNTKADMEIHAYNNNDNAEGSAFPGDDNDTEINITAVTFKLNGVATTATALGITVDLSGAGLILQDVGEGVTVDFTTAGGVGGTFDRFTIKNIDTEKDYFDIKEVHFSGDIPNAYNEEVGSFINFDDDGPSISTTGTEPTLTVDETLLGTNDTESFAANFSSVFGVDGAGTLTYALGFNAGATGLVDTATNQAVVLSLESGQVVGRAGVGGAIVFTVSVNAAGSVTLDQLRAVVHADANDPDDSTTLAADDLVQLTATITDKDGDHQSATLDIGQNLTFEDDGLSIVRSVIPVPELTVDESDTTSDTGDFSVLFTATFGNDGPADTGDGLTYALGVFGGGSDVASGLFDTQSGLQVLLNLEGDDIVGRAGTDEVFRISVAADGNVTLDQSRGVVHGDPTDPDEADTPATMAANLVTLTATTTDGDGDSAPNTVDIGDAFNFEDDGPAITVPFDGDPGTPGIEHETLANTAGASASGAYGYDIGADTRTDAFYAGGGSDFVDQNPGLAGVQIGLSGTIIGGGGGNVLTPEVTLASESATSATFNFSFTYDQDPAAGVQAGTAGGTLVFDKANDTYTITLNDPLEGFTFDILHTSELLSKEPTSNTGHPNIVVEKLFEADSTPDQTDRDFFVQFTANSTTNKIGFGLNETGDSDDATPADTAWNPDDLVTNNHEDWVSATRTTNGVAGDTIQKGELLTLRFFDHSPGIATEDITPNQTAGAMAIKFDGIGNSEDLMVILDLVSADGTQHTSKAIYVSNGDIFKTGQVPAGYATDFPLDNNDGLVIIEQNDYNGIGENWVIEGAQIMQSANGITGTAIDLNRTTGAGGGSTGTANFNLTDNDVLKIVDIGFTTTVTQTPDANLDFAFQVADADADQAAVQHILVDVA
ncbi:DUF5801 repeats-in-toxin domain-containing protein [Mesorhizobium amorphae]|uniref:DUF5801 domain-containing protein n=1 Tax=Mesorhizobium amorphae CCNWGS0123 TaxID=1082933 RepID=G6YKW9_9HYPH|nr:DUF5801 repeats-in-toxin domain-containing protein [Mesorhizobium amorphae]ANT50345.1 hypothetical protein A6B35_10650 [Mesorhizobium amorphae CCNWGS0123]EHH03484.1 hypothetical protein MEA186_33274 [Mesorhizobium amorphae CCNWGS0123]GLR42071.1 hypothetical protein GCM10007880_25870 [Mesorhizobium amorphae]